MARPRGAADCDMLASAAVLLLGIGLGSVRSRRAGQGGGLTGGVQKWGGLVQGCPAVDLGGGVTLRTCRRTGLAGVCHPPRRWMKAVPGRPVGRGRVGEQVWPTCAIRPDGGWRRRRGSPCAIEMELGGGARSRSSCERTAAATARWAWQRASVAYWPRLGFPYRRVTLLGRGLPSKCDEFLD
jgi:hypothetical protein